MLQESLMHCLSWRAQTFLRRGIGTFQYTPSLGDCQLLYVVYMQKHQESARVETVHIQSVECAPFLY